MRARGGIYDPQLLKDYARALGLTREVEDAIDVRIDSLRVGMTFAEDVRHRGGTLLIARGYKVTTALLERLAHIPRGQVHEPLRVIAGSPLGEPVHDQEWTGGLDRLLESVHPDDRARVAEVIEGPADGRQPEPVEYRCIKPNGDEVWVRDACAVVTTDGDRRLLQGLLFDITAAKRAEADRDRLELDLRLGQKLEAVGQLAAGIAHEINTPMQFVGDTVHFLARRSATSCELAFACAAAVDARGRGRPGRPTS